MSIQEIRLFFKQYTDEHEFLLTFIIIILCAGSFFFGRMSVERELGSVMKEEKSETMRIPPTNSAAPSSEDEGYQANMETSVQGAVNRNGVINSLQTTGAYVGSKSGTKYHLPWCSGAKRIKEENKVWFATKEEAENAGYTPAANCKGI